MTLELNPAVVRLVWDHMMCFFQVFPLGLANARSNVNFIATKLAKNESKIAFNMKTKRAVPAL